MRMMLVGAGAVGECILKVLKKRDPQRRWLSYVLIADYSLKRAEEVKEHLKQGGPCGFRMETVRADAVKRRSCLA